MLFLLECIIDRLHLGSGQLKYRRDGIQHVSFAVRIPGNNITDNNIFQIL